MLLLCQYVICQYVNKQINNLDKTRVPVIFLAFYLEFIVHSSLPCDECGVFVDEMLEYFFHLLKPFHVRSHYYEEAYNICVLNNPKMFSKILKLVKSFDLISEVYWIITHMV